MVTPQPLSPSDMAFADARLHQSTQGRKHLRFAGFEPKPSEKWWSNTWDDEDLPINIEKNNQKPCSKPPTSDY